MNEVSETKNSEAPITEVAHKEVPVDHLIEDVIEEEETLQVRRKRGKMVVSDSESTETERYAKEQDTSIPLLSMLVKNVVADQAAWNKSFKGVQQDLGSDWDFEDEGQPTP